MDHAIKHNTITLNLGDNNSNIQVYSDNDKQLKDGSLKAKIKLLELEVQSLKQELELTIVLLNKFIEVANED